MPFWRHYYHIIWATKNREPIIRADFESALYDYISRKAAEIDSSVIAINGWVDHVHVVIAIPPKHSVAEVVKQIKDHVHVVIAIPPKHSVAEVVKQIKGASAYYINHTFHLDGYFNWQRGYGSLTLGEKQLPIAEAYVRGQKRHHQEQTEIKRLEWAVEEDSGPEFKDPGARVARIREGEAAYETVDEIPF